MKYLRYIIFIVFICFFSMFNVKAYSSNETAYIQGKFNDGQVTISFTKENNINYIKVHTNGENDTKIALDENSNEINITKNHYTFKITKSNLSQMFDKNFNFNYNLKLEVMEGSVYHYAIEVVDEVTTKEKTCIYKMQTNTGGNGDPNLLITCNIINDNVTCFNNFNASKFEYQSLKSEYNCLDTIYADYLLNGTTYTINDLKKVNSCNNRCLTFELTNSSSNEQNTGSNGNASDPGVENGNFNTEAFCSKAVVKGAFRTIGWVIFFIKIIIPIIIIVLGSIDVFKAVTSNKSDELNKSIKTLVMRVIAGIIIFLIPTFIDFIIKFVSGGEEIYSEQDGTFRNCTYCMLNPTDDDCGSLMGGE